MQNLIPTAKRILEVAIAVRDGDLFLMATVVRTTATDVYVNWRRDHITDWKPHTSYHASGQHHQKSFDNEFLVKKKQQKPNASFNGTKNLVSFGLASGEHRALNVPCNPKDFTGVFEIPVALLRPEKYSTYVYVDLVEPGAAPILIPGAAIRQQERFKDAEPWIVLTFLEIPL